jgi:hypothetical protein
MSEKEKIEGIKNLLQEWTPPFALKILKALIQFLNEVCICILLSFSLVRSEVYI